ncbi:uncharacterized protein PAC_16841 [Phialocephala subalpina]|uniref:Ubiquitin-like domain-containing protein n=1 Tax=Phialocephala subalpina TaxID=576137 RepID=A0A1L7XPG5_9HELO|nr:uncharacterized protein PAC_16841 [Phialocephala subalpina]
MQSPVGLDEELQELSLLSVGFGFSAGDFIAALQLVSTVIDALRDSGDSSTEYRALISQLFTLEIALLTVKRLEVDDEQHAEFIALRQAACQCQRSKNTSQVCELEEKDNLVKFKADLVGHIESIELLLTTLHMGSTHIGRKSQKENQKSLISGQVERQQSVYLIDALGRHTLFYLEFVLSAEALTHVLRSNFRSIGSGSQKIDRGEFAIQDTSLKRDIDLSGPWEACFRPGQRVDMSMIFTSKKKTMSQSCPVCQQEDNDPCKENQDLECANCGIIFRRTFSRAIETSLLKFQAPSPQHFEVTKLKRKRPEDEEEDMALFRRVRIKIYENMNAQFTREQIREFRRRRLEKERTLALADILGGIVRDPE